MAEVGVLNLTIKDNSEQAGQGLKELAGALSAVKEAKRNFDLSKVGQQVVQLAKTIQAAKGTSTVVRNLGTMFNAINKFASLKSFNIDTEKIRDTAQNMLKLADAKEKVDAASKSGAGISDWRMGMNDLAATTKETVEDVTAKVETLGKTLTSFQQMIGKRTETQLFGGNQDLFTNVEETVQTRQAIDEVNEAIGTHVKMFDAATGGYREFDAQTGQFVDALETAKNSTTETDNTIANLIDRLNKPIDYSSFQDYANQVAGLKDRIIDLSAIQAFSIPATNPNGFFKYASDEIAFFSRRLSEAQSDVEFFGKKYEEVQKRIKYNGLTTERANEAAQYENSFYVALERAEEYESRLQLINDRIAQYKENMQGAGSIKDYFDVPELRPLLEGLEGAEAKMAAIQAISSGTGIGVDEIVRQLDQLTASAEQYETAAENVNRAVSEADTTATDAATGGMEAFREEVEEIVNAATPAVSKIELLRNKIEGLEKKIAMRRLNLALAGMDPDNDKDSFINSYRLQIGQVNEQIDKLINKAHEAQEAMRFDQMKQAAADSIVPWKAEDIDNLVNQYSEIDLLTMKMDGMKQALMDDINQNKVDTQQIAQRTIAIQQLRDKIEELKEAQETTTRTTISFRGAMDGLKGAVTRMFPTLTGLLKRFKSMAIMRGMRYMIRSISKGFSEGVQNVYQYSKIIGSSLAPNMDSAASSLLQFKNSIGAMAAPLINAFVPALQTVINWLIEGINYLNQFFALLNGQTSWTKAIYNQTSAYDDTANAAKKAAAATKDLLADWDELNVIQNQNSGSAATTTKKPEDYESMFEETSAFSEDIKNLVAWIEEHMDLIKGIAETIGVAILGWKLSNAFLGGLADLRSLALEGLGIAVGLQLTWTGAHAAGLNGGFDASTLLTTAAGILTTTISAALLGYEFAGPWGAIIGGASGLILSLAVAVTAYYDGERTRKQRAKWGKLHLTEDEINDLVDTQVTAGVLVKMEIMQTSVMVRQEQRKKTNESIARFGASLEAAKFAYEADGSKEAFDTALESAKTAIGEIQKQLVADKEGLSLSFTKFTYKDKDGNDITSELYASLLEGNTALNTFFTGMGNDIATFISKGFSEGLTEQEQLMAIDLMETLNKITSTAQTNYLKKKAVRDTESDMEGVYDMETAQGVLARQQARLDEYKNTVASQMKEDLESNYEYLEYYKAIQDYYKGKGDTAKVEQYSKYIEDTLLAIGNLEKNVGEIRSGTYAWDLDETYSGMVGRMRDMWKEKFGEWYKDTFYQSLFDDSIESPFDNNLVAADILNFYGLSPSSLLSEEELAKYYQYVIDKYNGNLDQALAEVQSKIPEQASQAMLSKYFPKAFTGGMSNDEITENIKKGLWNILLTGTNKDSDLWRSMYAEVKKNYGSDKVEEVFKQEYKWMETLYTDMLEHMMSGMSKEDFIQEYADKGWLANTFMNRFSDELQYSPSTDAKKEVDEISKIITDASVTAAKIFGAGMQVNINPEIDSGELEKEIDNTLATLGDYDNKFGLYVEPDVELSDDAQNYIEMIQNAVNSGLGMEEIKSAGSQAYEMFGLNAYLEALPYINQLIEGYKELQKVSDIDEYSGPRTNGAMMTPWRTTGMAGASSVGYANQSYVHGGIVTTEPVSNDQEVNNTAQGVQRGSADMLSALQSILRVAEAIQKKEFKVVVTPNSSWARHNGASQSALNYVTGDV